MDYTIFYKDEEEPTFVATIEPNRYFISSSDKTWIQSCPDTIPLIVDACKHCIISLPCGCNLKGENIFIPSVITDCQNSTQTNLTYAINLSVLLEFYKDFEQIHNISSHDTFDNPALPHFPEFDIISKNFSNVISTDKKLEYSLKKVVKNIKSKSPMYISDTSRLADNLGLLIHPITNKLHNVFVALSFVMSTIAIFITCRNFRMLTVIRTAEALDFPNAQSTTKPTRGLDVYLAEEMHELIRMITFIFITVFLVAVVTGVSCVLRKFYVKYYAKELKTMPIHTSLYVALYAKGHVFLRKLIISPVKASQIMIKDEKPFIKPTLTSVMFYLRGVMRFDWSFIQVHQKENGRYINLPTKIPISAFDVLNLHDILNNLETLRLIAVFNDSCYDVYTWNAPHSLSEFGQADTVSRPRCVCDNPILSEISDPDSV